jgi:uncharacterized protein
VSGAPDDALAVAAVVKDREEASQECGVTLGVGVAAAGGVVEGAPTNTGGADAATARAADILVSVSARGNFVTTISTDDPLAVAVVEAIHRGDVATLRRLLSEHPHLPTAWLGDDEPGCMSRALLHVATDWPGHFPNGAATVAALVEAGADVNARFHGPHNETPLHWAASSDDVDVLDALLDAGADIEAAGAVIAGGTPLTDATAFGQWTAARRLVERGARTNYFADASLGLMQRLRQYFDQPDAREPDQVNDAFWAACHGGQLEAAEYLLARGAEVNRLPGWEEMTPLDAAARSGAHDVITWLHARGARTASELRGD